MAFWGGTQTPMRQLLEVTVDRCYNLEDRGPFEYWCVLTYGGSTRRSQPCFGRGTHTVFEEKFVFEFTEGDVELNIWVLTNQPSGNDQVIGFLRVHLQPLLSNGYVDSTWTLQRTDGRPAGNIRLTLQFPSSSRFQGQDSNYTAPTLDSTAPVGASQRPILYQLLPYDSLPPPRPNAPYPPNSAQPSAPYPPNSAQPNAPYPPNSAQPNATGPAALWSQLLPYGSPPPAAPACAYNPPNSAQPNATGPAALWSQLLPYGSPPPAAPACAYNPTTSPPVGYPLPQYPIYTSTPPGLSPSSDIYPPPPR